VVAAAGGDKYVRYAARLVANHAILPKIVVRQFSDLPLSCRSKPETGKAEERARSKNGQGRRTGKGEEAKKGGIKNKALYRNFFGFFAFAIKISFVPASRTKKS
jgi:hypothetical protein